MADADEERAQSAEDKFNDVVHQFFRDTEGAMVVKWMFQGEIIDNDGQSAMWTLESPDMAVWDMLGIIRYMDIHIAGKIQHRDRLSEEDDDD